MMLKKIFLLLFGISLLSVDKMKCCPCNPKIYELSPTGKVVVAGVLSTGVVVGAVVAAPLVLPAATIGAIQATTAAAATAAANVASSVLFPATILGKVGIGLTAATLTRPYILQTTEEHLRAIQKEGASRPTDAKIAFIGCLKSNKNSKKNSSGCPTACESLAAFYAFNSSFSELKARTEAFNSGKCFCD